MRRLPAVLVALTLALTATPAAARTVTAVDQRVAGDAAQVALSFVRSNRSLFGAPASAESTLHVARRTTLPRGEAIRVGQKLGQLRVVDAGVTVLVLDGRLVSASGTLARVEASSRLPSIDRDQAGDVARAIWAGARVRRAELALLPRRGAAARSVWALDLLAVDPLDVREVWIDADSGQLLGSRSRVRHASGKAYGSNPTVSKVEVVDLLGLAGEGAELAGEHADVSSCKITWSQQGGDVDCVRKATPDAEGNFLFEPDDPSLEDAFAEVHAYYHVDRIHRWFSDRFGFVRPTESQQIQVMVNTAFQTSQGDVRELYNAMFADMNGDGAGELIFGQGDRDFAYDADVIYHEFTHSVVDALGALDLGFDAFGLNLAPTALNEGFADVFAAFLSGDPAIGEYAGGPSGAIRTLTGTASCPDALIGETHSDGLVWGEAIWTIRSKLTTAADKSLFEEVVYQTLAGLGTSPYFSDAAAVLLKVTQTVAPALETAVKAELTTRNLLDCPRIIPLSPAKPREVYLLGGRGFPNDLAPAAYQYSIEVPQGAEKLELKVTYDYQLWGESGVGLFIRKGDAVGFDLKVVHDQVMVNPQLSYTLEVGHAERPLEPGATYYVLPVNVERWGAMFTLSAVVTEAEPPVPDAGVDAAEPDAGPEPDAGVDAAAEPDAAADAGVESEDDGSEGGCSCDVGPRRGAGLLPLLGLLLLLARRRRR